MVMLGMVMMMSVVMLGMIVVSLMSETTTSSTRATEREGGGATSITIIKVIRSCSCHSSCYEGRGVGRRREEHLRAFLHLLLHYHLLRRGAVARLQCLNCRGDSGCQASRRVITIMKRPAMQRPMLMLIPIMLLLVLLIVTLLSYPVLRFLRDLRGQHGAVELSNGGS